MNERVFGKNTDSPVLKDCVRQLDEYFSGSRKVFSIPMHPEGTHFQKKIWTLLHQIPFGETISYLELALMAGSRKLIRAVGAANGANPLAIIVPCHRVIGNEGKLTGYAGGLRRKEWLLKFERKIIRPELFDMNVFQGRPNNSYTNEVRIIAGRHHQNKG
ncbi:MAG TPA: methylated-DNA--[protein]-cysteine S-methyltransferase [Chitinophagales bacterium]|nr:methylated-DNA--[protein]-cysteine S-methyltransferase [Chitinophagales bacterium]